MWTIVTTVYNQYELLRQLTESVLHHLPDKDWDKLVIFDDYSDPRGTLRAYEDHLSANPKIEIINHPTSRPDSYSFVSGNYNPEDFDEDKSSMGPPVALSIALSKVKTPYVLIVDTDTFFTSASSQILKDMALLFRMNPDVMVMGQMQGYKGSDIRKVCVPFPCKTHITGKGSEKDVRGGYITCTAFACRMDGFRTHGLIPMTVSREPVRMGWPSGAYLKQVFDKGFCSLNYPLYSEGHLIHLGGGTIRPIRGEKVRFGFCNDCHRYGSRLKHDYMLDYCSGRYMVKLSSEEYEAYLKEKYTSDFTLKPPIDEALLEPVD